MPLTGKYLKYKPEITLEIFTLIYKKLLKHKLISNLDYIKSDYPNFSSQFNFLKIPMNGKTVGCYSQNYENYKETTVQEILGYDPFVKEEFILPKNWICKMTNESKGTLNNYRRNFVNYDNEDCSWDYMLPNGSGGNLIDGTEITFDQFKKYVLKEYIEQPKQSLKQAVHCKTQEEWNFVSEKLNYNWINAKFGINRDCISLNAAQNSSKIYWKSKDYKILSFQEWWDLIGYKIENEVKFEVGKWYKNLGNSNKLNNFGKFLSIRNGCEFWMSECIYQEHKVDVKEQWLHYSDKTVECSIEEIQQYLPDGHVDKIKPVIQQTIDMQSKFKVGEYVVSLDKSNNYIVDEFCIISRINKTHLACKNKPQDDWSMKPFRNFRHATPEEINNHLISIGQIPAEYNENDYECTNPNSLRHDSCGEKYGCKQDCGSCDYYQLKEREEIGNIAYKDERENFFNPNIEATKKTDWTVKVHYEPKLILSINDEELPMVNIIKTNSIKQLLNND